MVTPSCSTALRAFVMYDISPRKKFEPRLYRMAIPIPAIKMNGITHESMNSASTQHARTTARHTYTGSSASASSLRSSTNAVIPLTKHCLFPIFLISETASRLSSADVEVSKNTAIRVVSPLLNLSYMFSGIIS